MHANKKKEVLTLLPIYAWVMIITIGGHLLNIHNSWVFGIMVPIFFIMGGEINTKIKTVVGGAPTSPKVRSSAMRMAPTRRRSMQSPTSRNKIILRRRKP